VLLLQLTARKQLAWKVRRRFMGFEFRRPGGRIPKLYMTKRGEG